MRARARDLEAAVAGRWGRDRQFRRGGRTRQAAARGRAGDDALRRGGVPGHGGLGRAAHLRHARDAELDAAVVRDAAAARARFASQPVALTEIEALLTRYLADREACARRARPRADRLPAGDDGGDARDAAPAYGARRRAAKKR